MKKKKEEGGPASLEETHYRTLLQEALSFVLPERQAERFTAMLLERFGSFAGVKRSWPPCWESGGPRATCV